MMEKLLRQKEVFILFEKVNPMHPDKIANCIAESIVDLSYKEK
nr:S-adenosylmethionine synthetase N-terminal domain-containing protein [Anaerococcus marasmi]